MKNLYKILEISQNATLNEIKRKYRELAKKYHPDKFSNTSDEEKKQAEDKFREINEAYSILSDEARKKEYDKQLGQRENFSKEKLKNSNDKRSTQNFEDIYKNFTDGGLFNNFFKPKSKKDETAKKLKDKTNDMFESFFFQRRK